MSRRPASFSDRIFVSDFFEERETEPGNVTIYAVRSGDLVKFGRTRNIRKRLSQLQTSSAEPLGVYFEYRAKPSEETHIHARFAEFREGGEWFRLEEPVRQFIEDKQMEIMGRLRATAMAEKAAREKSRGQPCG